MCFARFAQLMVNIIGLLNVLFATPSPILRPSIHYWIIFDRIDQVQRGEENLAVVPESVHEDREESIRSRLQQLRLTHGTTWRILRRDLKLKAYKIQLVQELKQLGLPNLLEKFQEDPTFSSKFFSPMRPIFGYVNKQNSRIWNFTCTQTFSAYTYYGS